MEALLLFGETQGYNLWQRNVTSQAQLTCGSVVESFLCALCADVRIWVIMIGTQVHTYFITLLASIGQHLVEVEMAFRDTMTF